jgi:lipopolysaccharide/colanic/teichoic acid biosynthesis glycosyltransferase
MLIQDDTMIDSTRSAASKQATVYPHSLQDRLGAKQLEVPKYFSRKMVFMRILAGLLLICCGPIMLLAMLLVRVTSPGPALFRQTRLGKGGRPFDVLKIRTMYRDAETLSGPVLCQPGDSRVTPVGRLLRFLHLDELPQLINVVRGEMCLVGPRPERPEIISRHRLKELVPGFAERIAVLPGVTGLAQINLPADQTADCVIPKVKLDIEYISTANVSLDLRILLCTAMRMIGIRHGRAVRLLGLNRSTGLSPRQTHTDLEHLIDARLRRCFNGYPKLHANPSAALAYASSNRVFEASTGSIESTDLDSQLGSC